MADKQKEKQTTTEKKTKKKKQNKKKNKPQNIYNTNLQMNRKEKNDKMRTSESMKYCFYIGRLIEILFFFVWFCKVKQKLNLA